MYKHSLASPPAGVFGGPFDPGLSPRRRISTLSCVLVPSRLPSQVTPSHCRDQHRDPVSKSLRLRHACFSAYSMIGITGYLRHTSQLVIVYGCQIRAILQGDQYV